MQLTCPGARVEQFQKWTAGCILPHDVRCGIGGTVIHHYYFQEFTGVAKSHNGIKTTPDIVLFVARGDDHGNPETGCAVIREAGKRSPDGKEQNAGGICHRKYKKDQGKHALWSFCVQKCLF